MRRLTQGVLGAVLVSLILAGCGSGGDDDKGDEDGKVSISLWAVPLYLALPGYEDESANPGDWERYLADEFQKTHPDVNIDVVSVDWGNVATKVTAAVQARKQPDIYFDAAVRLLQWQPAGLTVDINDLVSEETLGKINPAVIKAETVGDQLVDFPVYSDPAGALTCNPALFESVGAPLPDDGVWTYDQFEDAGEKLAAAGKYLTVARLADEQGDYDWLGFFYGFGARPFSDDLSQATLSSPEGTEAMAWLADANKKGWLLPGTATISFGDVAAAYNSGKLGCMGGTIRSGANLEAAKAEGQADKSVEAKLMLYPYKESLGGPQFGQLPADAGYLVFNNDYSDAEKKAIGEFLEFISDEKYQLAQAQAGNASTFNDIKVVAPEGTESSVTADFDLVSGWFAEYGTLEQGYAVPGFASCRVDRVPQVQAGVLGTLSPEDALKAADDACNLDIENATVN